MRALAALLMFALAPAPSGPPTRGEIDAMEQSMFQKLMRFHVDAPLEVLGPPRGIYLDGFGAVFTSEVNLVQAPGVSPFRPQLSKEDVARIHDAKLKRLPEFRELMKRMLVDSAMSLDRLPADEQMVVATIFFHNRWEDRSGLPQVIRMQAKRSALMDPHVLQQPDVIRVREE